MRGTKPAAAGTVTAVSGNTITLNDKRTGTIFAVDAGGAAIEKFVVPAGGSKTPPTLTTITVSGIAVGDNIVVQGTVSGATITATKITDGVMGGPGGFRGRHAPLGNDGNINAINGTTITMQEEANEGGASYNVDASKATVTNNGAAATISDLKVGDKIFVRGTVTGTNVAATTVSVGHPVGMGMGRHHGAPSAQTN